MLKLFCRIFIFCLVLASCRSQEQTSGHMDPETWWQGQWLCHVFRLEKFIGFANIRLYQQDKNFIQKIKSDKMQMKATYTYHPNKNFQFEGRSNSDTLLTRFLAKDKFLIRIQPQDSFINCQKNHPPGSQ